METGFKRRVEEGKKMSEPKARFKLSPELSDGSSCAVVDNINDVLQSIQDWHDNDPEHLDGDNFKVEIVMMTDEEVEALPEL